MGRVLLEEDNLVLEGKLLVEDSLKRMQEDIQKREHTKKDSLIVKAEGKLLVEANSLALVDLLVGEDMPLVVLDNPLLLENTGT